VQHTEWLPPAAPCFMAEPTLTPAAAPDVRLLRSITLRNILSFGPDTPPLELRALNVLIGPNGSGKSNLLDAVELLKKAPDAENLRGAVGGENWLWKGKPKADFFDIITESDWNQPGTTAHLIRLSEQYSAPEWHVWEVITHESIGGFSRLEFESGFPRFKINVSDKIHEIDAEDYNSAASCLFQFRAPYDYPILTQLGNSYRRIRLYREWTFGRNSTPRLPRRTDERNDFLAEDGSNLGLVLSKMSTYPETKDKFIEALNELYDGIRDFSVLTEGGTAQIFLREGNTMIPATRLSDGTLRYLCLLAILLHPTPPPLICLEEPELGLHPDAIVAVGKLIKEASTRTQLIITTHSQILVDTFQESPEDVVVVSKQDGCTQFKRLDAEKLRPYLETDSLGNLWNSGQFGGNRW
jgi:predicted ATPase